MLRQHQVSSHSNRDAACAPYLELLSAEMDGELHSGETRRLSAHLRRCASCSAERDALLAYRESLEGLSELEIPVTLQASIRAALAVEAQQQDCLAHIKLLSPFLDGELESGERDRLASHLAACRSCTTQLRSLRRTIAVVSSLPSIDPPSSLRSRILSRTTRTVRLPVMHPVYYGLAAAALSLVMMWPGDQLVPSARRLRPLPAAAVAHSISHVVIAARSADSPAVRGVKLARMKNFEGASRLSPPTRTFAPLTVRRVVQPSVFAAAPTTSRSSSAPSRANKGKVDGRDTARGMSSGGEIAPLRTVLRPPTYPVLPVEPPAATRAPAELAMAPSDRSGESALLVSPVQPRQPTRAAAADVPIEVTPAATGGSGVVRIMQLRAFTAASPEETSPNQPAAERFMARTNRMMAILSRTRLAFNPSQNGAGLSTNGYPILKPLSGHAFHP